MEWLDAIPREALVGILVAAPFAWLLARRLRARAMTRSCRRCGDGYRVEVLEPVARDGAHACVRCPSCKTWYAVATTNRDVFKVDESYVAARWPEVPVRPGRAPSSLEFAGE